MFEVSYLFVLALAVLPLAYTLLQGAGGNRIAFVHRLYREAAYILAVLLGIIFLEVALSISLENYWFDELGQSHRFLLSIEYRVGTFLVTLLLVGLLSQLISNCYVACFLFFRRAPRGSLVLPSLA